MPRIPTDLRARFAALGELARPLGGMRAAALGRELASGVIAEISAGRDPDALLDAWFARIAREICVKTQPAARRRGVRPVKDLLPEFALARAL